MILSNAWLSSDFLSADVNQYTENLYIAVEENYTSLNISTWPGFIAQSQGLDRPANGRTLAVNPWSPLATNG